MHVRISETNTFKRHPHSHQHRRSRRRRRCRRCRQCPRCSHNLLAQHECWTFGIQSQQQSRAIRELLWLMCTQKVTNSGRCTAYVQRARRSLTLCIDNHWSKCIHQIKCAWLCACVANAPPKSVIVLSEFSLFIASNMKCVMRSFIVLLFIHMYEKSMVHMCNIMCASYGLVKFQFSMMREGIRLLVVHTIEIIIIDYLLCKRKLQATCLVGFFRVL